MYNYLIDNWEAIKQKSKTPLKVLFCMSMVIPFINFFVMMSWYIYQEAEAYKRGRDNYERLTNVIRARAIVLITWPLLIGWCLLVAMSFPEWRLVVSLSKAGAAVASVYYAIAFPTIIYFSVEALNRHYAAVNRSKTDINMR